MYSRFTGFFCKGDEGRSERGTVRLHLFFFFFFLNFGLTRPFRPIQADTADMAESTRFWPHRRRFPPNRRRLQPRRPDSGLATWHDAVRRGTDVRSAASLPRRTRVRRPWGRVRASQVVCHSL